MAQCIQRSECAVTEGRKMIAEEVQVPKNEKPLLTIAIPTYNRARYLRENLAVLFDQVVAEPRVELIISDNASPDETPGVVRAFVERGLQVRYLRNEANVGADANFLQCFELARGKYTWIFADDDFIVAGGIAKVLRLLESSDFQLVLLCSYSFRDDHIAEMKSSKLAGVTERYSSGLEFARRVGAGVTFISGMIINKDQIGRA